MTTVEWLLLVVAYLLGVAVIAVAETKPWHLDELLALLGWPVVFPTVWPVNVWRRHRTRCRVCKLRYGNRAAMLRHRTNAHSDTTGEQQQ